jgi:hypothetical protein
MNWANAQPLVLGNRLESFVADDGGLAGAKAKAEKGPAATTAGA